MKLSFSALLLAISFVAAACSGGGSTPPPPPPVGKFSTASLKGQYAYSMSGEDLNGAFISRVGSFTADGNGNITQALEDVNSVNGVATVSFSGGSYTVQANGRGVITLTNANSSLLLSIALLTSSKGFMIQTDLAATSSGNFNLQTPSTFNNAGIKNNYVFDVSGVDAGHVAPISIVGQVQTDGNGNVKAGTIDVNDGATLTSAVAVPASAYAIDPVNGATFGRGQITIDGLQFVFSIVDNTRFKMMEIDTGATLGDAVLQTGTIPTTTAGLSGGFAFLIGGSAVLGTQGPYVRAGRVALGSGSLSNIFFDDNNFGTRNSFMPSNNPTSATVAIDSTAGVVGSGRATMTFTEPGFNPFSFVVYLSSPTNAVIQDTTVGFVGDGSMLAQAAGPINISNTANFAFNWSGINLGSSHNIEFEEDFVGQYSPGTTSAGGFNGAMDFTELGSTNKVLFPNTPITVSLTTNGDGTGVNGYQVVTGNSPSTTFAYHAYFVDANTIFLIGHDDNHVIAGTVLVQP